MVLPKNGEKSSTPSLIDLEDEHPKEKGYSILHYRVQTVEEGRILVTFLNVGDVDPIVVENRTQHPFTFRVRSMGACPSSVQIPMWWCCPGSSQPIPVNTVAPLSAVGWTSAASTEDQVSFSIRHSDAPVIQERTFPSLLDPEKEDLPLGDPQGCVCI